MQDLQAGTGAEPLPGQTVKVHCARPRGTRPTEALAPSSARGGIERNGSFDFGRNRPRLRYDFKIVDINGVAQGNEYWNAASQMPPITLADAAKLFSQ